jgi:hypothetical protein
MHSSLLHKAEKEKLKLLHGIRYGMKVKLHMTLYESKLLTSGSSHFVSGKRALGEHLHKKLGGRHSGSEVGDRQIFTPIGDRIPVVHHLYNMIFSVFIKKVSDN